MLLFLCLTRLPGAEEITVKVLRLDDVPAKGEEVRFIAVVHTEDEIDRIRVRFTDEHLLKGWDANICLRKDEGDFRWTCPAFDDEDLYRAQNPRETRLSEMFSEPIENWDPVSGESDSG